MFVADYIALIGLVAAITIYAVKNKDKRRDVFFGCGFFIVTIFLVLKFLPFGNETYVNDRYLYIPSIGLFYVLSLLVCKKNKSSLAFCGLIIVSCSYLSFERNKVWKNSETLWSNVIENYPKTPHAYNNLGNYYEKNGQLEKAEKSYLKTIEVNPREILGRTNLGNILKKRGDLLRAIEIYHQASATYLAKPNHFKLWHGIKWETDAEDLIWVDLLKNGILELPPDATHRILRIAFGISAPDWMTLVRIGKGGSCRGILIFTSDKSLKKEAKDISLSTSKKSKEPKKAA